MPVDVVFGGQFFVQAAAADCGLTLDPIGPASWSGPARSCGSPPASRSTSGIRCTPRSAASASSCCTPGRGARASRPQHCRAHRATRWTARPAGDLARDPRPLALRHRDVRPDGRPARPRRPRDRRGLRPPQHRRQPGSPGGSRPTTCRGYAGGPARRSRAGPGSPVSRAGPSTPTTRTPRLHPPRRLAAGELTRPGRSAYSTGVRRRPGRTRSVFSVYPPNLGCEATTTAQARSRASPSSWSTRTRYFFPETSART